MNKIQKTVFKRLFMRPIVPQVSILDYYGIERIITLENEAPGRGN